MTHGAETSDQLLLAGRRQVRPAHQIHHGNMDAQRLPVREATDNQSIGDVAVFVNEFVKSQWPGVTQVVTFGGSYPGALSAWIRLRLPHLISAAFSTSSPVRAVIDFTGG